MITVVAVFVLASASRLIGDGSWASRPGSRVWTCAMHKGGHMPCGRTNLSVLAGDPIENLRGCDRPLRRMGIQGPGNRAPTLLDDLPGKLARFGFILEFAGRASQPALSVVALRRYIR